MPEAAMKMATTKLGKQLSGSLLLYYDMRFAARAFALASIRRTRPASERQGEGPSVEERMRVFEAADPFLRAGATVAALDEDGRDDVEAERSGLFEAGVITYGRCFNSGLRSGLSKKIFAGDLSSLKSLHESIIRTRNSHIAHATMKMEKSIVGVQLIHDPSYGKRPNMVLTALAIRRHYPTDAELVELESHCLTIVKKVIEPRIVKTARALREQLLAMPPEQLEALPDFGTTVPNIETII